MGSALLGSLDSTFVDINGSLDASFIDIIDSLDKFGIADAITMAYEDLSIMGYTPDFGWQQKIPLEINAGQVPSTQTNVPLVINDTYTGLVGAVEAELRFGDENNVLFDDYDIIEFNDVTGKLIAWYRKPSVSDGDIVNIFFDNPGEFDKQNPPGVYDANYNRVYHLHEDANDSTINGENLTIFSDESLGFVPGKIGNAYDFPGDSTLDYMIQNPVSVFPTTAFTIEMWVKTTGSADGIFSYAAGSEDNALLLFNQSALSVIVGTGHAFTIGFDNDTFRKVDVTWNSITGLIRYYIDGDLVDTSPPTSVGTSLENGGSLVLGQEQDSVGGGFQSSQAFLGTLSEVALSNIERSADYLKLKSNNQDSQDTFYSTGATAPVITSDVIAMGYET